MVNKRPRRNHPPGSRIKPGIDIGGRRPRIIISSERAGGFDSSGRLVRIVLDETLEAGEHATFWDGRNDRGEMVGSGIYFYRLDAGTFSETRPLVRLR